MYICRSGTSLRFASFSALVYTLTAISLSQAQRQACILLSVDCERYSKGHEIAGAHKNLHRISYIAFCVRAPPWRTSQLVLLYHHGSGPNSGQSGHGTPISLYRLSSHLGNCMGLSSSANLCSQLHDEIFWKGRLDHHTCYRKY